MTSFTRELNRLLGGIMLAFGVMLLAALYYAVVGHWTLTPRDDNPRLVEAERSVVRGGLYDRDRDLIVQTVIGPGGFATRETLHPAFASATGYYSFRYGTAGAEAAYNDLLSGVDTNPTLAQSLLGRPREGSDIQLTFDLEVQQAVVEAMGGRRGATIVMTVPRGELLALASLPTYDPNTLNQNWDTLVADPGEPFFNRALQGRYQPGTLMQLPLLLGAMVKGQPLSVTFPSGTVPIELDNLTLTCLTMPPSSEITLRQAYLFGCPAPFAQIAPNLGTATLGDTYRLLRVEETPLLPGFLPDPPDPPLSTALNRANLQELVLGQGDIRVSPIAMTSLTAAIINDGNAPQPATLRAIRPPGASQWLPTNNQKPTEAYMTAQNARRLSEIMRASATEGTASTVDWANLDVGGQAGLAYSGDTTQVWFIGFAILENKQNVVVTVVLEDTTDPNEAAQIAKQAILAADTAIPATETAVPSF